MMRSKIITVSLIAGISAVMVSPPAYADDSVTYEVLSQTAFVSSVNVEYNDHSNRISLQRVPLPWRRNVTVIEARSASQQGAEVRADWRPAAAPSRWVTVRIFVRGALICENTLDVGDATCYGSTPFIS
jgi:hypothetical protein